MQHSVLAVKCPKCGKRVDLPTKKLENSYFCLAAYTCPQCNTSFKASF